RVFARGVTDDLALAILFDDPPTLRAVRGKRRLDGRRPAARRIPAGPGHRARLRLPPALTLAHRPRGEEPPTAIHPLTRVVGHEGRDLHRRGTAARFQRPGLLQEPAL